MEPVHTIEPAEHGGSAGFAVYRHGTQGKVLLDWFTSYDMAAQAYPDARAFHPAFTGALRED